ncbi:hypothetical protein BCV70DRAFT_192906 [Testicularia cyperi]|uniref:C3H1-type domain-containing protein n=1 Tax=Testicularia cyperi TaxID=1882483 RepID=A0A317XM66_9BASI|nr:hypothetical protein BCV70DRAFT_192906 [Testicularia cyperi]
MLFEESHTDDLKAWLTAELGPICDADPEVLADYVLALLKHEASEEELQKLLTEQLEDFLAEQTEGFVARTFEALSTSAYLPGAAPDTVDQPSTETSVGDLSLEGSKKRRADEDADGTTHSPPRQSRKLNDESAGAQDGRRERDSRERQQASTDATAANGSREGHNRKESRKQMCRDYHNMGYCPRGANCKFEHSSDNVAGPGPNRGGQFPMVGMMGPGGPGNMGGMRPPSNMMFPGAPFGMPPQGWNPNTVHMSNQQQPQQQQPGQLGADGGNLASRLGGQVPMAPAEGFIMGGSGGESAFSSFGQHSGAGHQGGQAGGRGAMAGRGRGRGGGPPGTFASSRRSNTTLVIENVPVENLDLIKVNDYFKKFGTITNISIDKPGSKALVSYSQPSEAKAAHESPEVIFGNRFVKVYFQRLDEANVAAAPQQQQQQQQQQQRQPHLNPAAVPFKSNFVPGKNVYHARPPVASPGGGVSDERKKLLEDQKAKQLQLDTQLGEQKTLLAKFGDKSLSADDKKQILAQLKKLGEDIKVSTETVKAAVEALQAAPKESPAAATPGAGADAAALRQEREKREKELLDRELDLHAKSSSPSSTTEELKKKLESLKAEAASLGIDGTAAGGYAGRGRGRGGYVPRGRGTFSPFGRGRGAAVANRSLRLDNRTTRLQVTDLPADADKAKVHEHFAKFGEVESVEDGGKSELTVVYKQRSSGEQALRAGTEIPEIGSVKLSWVQAPFSSGSSAVTASADGDVIGEGVGAASTDANGDASNTGGDEEYEEDRDANWKR